MRFIAYLKGYINLLFNVSPLFQTIQTPISSRLGISSQTRKLSFFERIKFTSISSVFMRHSFSIPLSFGNNSYFNDKITFTLIGQMLSKNKTSEKNIIGVMRYVYSPTIWFEVGAYLLDPKLLFSKLVCTFNKDL